MLLDFRGIGELEAVDLFKLGVERSSVFPYKLVFERFLDARGSLIYSKDGDPFEIDCLEEVGIAELEFVGVHGTFVAGIF
jgi:hypothetical protein